MSRIGPVADFAIYGSRFENSGIRRTPDSLNPQIFRGKTGRGAKSSFKNDRRSEDYPQKLAGRGRKSGLQTETVQAFGDSEITQCLLIRLFVFNGPCTCRARY